MAIDLTRIGKLHVGLLGATGSVAYATHWIEPGSLLLGGAVMGVNFWLLRLITNVLRSSAERASRSRAAVAVAAMTLKFALFLGLLAAVFWRLPIEGMSFACGVTLLLLACVIEAARSEWRATSG
jgi:divalent metal cation (Fe/Co/Zn/Cd) transporter